MNINASNPSLINTLLQQAAKTKDKKRPTFEEVFAKLNARTAGMNANKNPINNMLTNEQLFRYYLKETDPKLRVSDDSFNIEDTLNPMKESDPTKVYGRGTTQISDVIPSQNPYNNRFNIGYQDPLQAQIEAQARAAGITGRTGPISGRLAALAQQYNTPFAMPPMAPPQKIPTTSMPSMPPAGAAGAAGAAPADPTAYPDLSGSIPIPIGGDAVIIDYNMVKDELAGAENMMTRLSSIDWSSIAPETQTIFSILFNNNDFYTTETTEYMKGLIRAGTIDRALEGINQVFKQTKTNQAVNNFITDRMAVMMGIDLTSGIGAVENFNKLFNPNNIGIGEGKMTMERFSINVVNYLNKQRTLQGNEKLRVDKTIIDIEDRGIAANATKYIGDITARLAALELQYNAIMPSPTALMTDLFYDGASEITTNTDINSTVIDPQIVDKIIGRRELQVGATPPIMRPPPLDIPMPSILSPSSTIAEAGTPAGIDIDNVISRRGRGVQAGDIRGPYEKTRKKEAASTLQATIRRGLQQGMGGAKGGTSV
jgi:hypothetical protein